MSDISTESAKAPEQPVDPSGFFVIDDLAASQAATFEVHKKTLERLRDLHNNIVAPYFDHRDQLQNELIGLNETRRGVGVLLGSEDQKAAINEELQHIAGRVSEIPVVAEADGNPGIVASIDRETGKTSIKITLQPTRDGSVVPGQDRRFFWGVNQPDEVYEQDLVTLELTRYEINGPRIGINDELDDPNPHSVEYDMTASALQACADAIAENQ